MDSGTAEPVLPQEMAGIGRENDASLADIKNSSEIIIFNSLPVKLNSGMPVVTFGSAGRNCCSIKREAKHH